MPAMDDAAERAARSARELARRTGSDRHDVLLVLGSGLTGAAEILGAGGDSLPLDTLPFFPRYTAAGHRAQGWSVDVAGKRVLVFGGRCHLYEGIEPDEAVHPLRTGVAAGCTTVVLTAAVGGIRDDLTTGSVMVVEDHLNLTGRSPLRGPDLRRHGRRLLARAARSSPSRLPARREPVVSPRPGVYAQVSGPQFETPAEIRMLRTLRRGRRGHVHGARDHRRPARRRPRCWASPWSPTLPRARQPARPATSRPSPTSAPRPRPPWPTSSATS